MRIKYKTVSFYAKVPGRKKRKKVSFKARARR
jgi:hypothetical protein